jgi:hypothetical protein
MTYACFEEGQGPYADSARRSPIPTRVDGDTLEQIVEFYREVSDLKRGVVFEMEIGVGKHSSDGSRHRSACSLPQVTKRGL